MSHNGGLMKYTWWIVLVWTFILMGLLTRDLSSIQQASRNLAIMEARTHFQKDKAFRFWSSTHGGFYVPINKRTPSNPYLEHIIERDIETPSGVQLTLMNPAYAIRQMNEEFTEDYGITGHITSLMPLRLENAPDNWEKSALESFENGENEVLEFIEFDGQESLRLMQPLIVQKGCLKCHSHQGYKVGDIRGGVSVSVPLTTFLGRKKEISRKQITSFSIVWLLGFVGIILSSRVIKKKTNKEEYAQLMLQKSHNQLETTVQKRTSELTLSNQSLQTEIIEHKKAEEALWRSEKRYRTLFDNMINSFAFHEIELDNNKVPIDYTFIEVNDAFEKQTGLQKGKIIGKKVTEVLPGIENDSTGWIQLYGNVALTGESISFENFSEPLNKWYLVNAYSPQKGYFATIFKDITIQKQEEKALKDFSRQLQERNEELDAFSHTVAHDLKGPLGTMMNFADLLKESYSELSKNETMKFLENIIKSGNKTQQIIDNLLLFASVRNQEILQEELDMGNIVEESIKRLSQKIKETEAKINLPDIWPVTLGNTYWIEEVWVNYLSNAIKYGGNPLQIEIGVDIENSNDIPKEMVRFWVRDNGKGISPDNQKKVFNPFERLEQIKTEGNGLGLSIVNRIIKKLGGQVGVESELGKGSLFYFTLPVRKTNKNII